MRIVLSLAVVFLIVVGLVAAGSSLALRGEPVNQPILFNHAIHIEEARLECVNCHTDAPHAVHAGLPGKDSCLECHDPDETEDEAEDAHPEKVKLVGFADANEEIPWVRVALTRPDVYFSHRRHVTSAGIECVRCHEDQPQLTAPLPTIRWVMTMDDCIECHEDSGASVDCLACHR